MQSSIAILLRSGILLGCLAAFPLMAAGGVEGLDRCLAEAKSWWERHQAPSPLIAPRSIQVELPSEALQYRDFAPLAEDLPASETSPFPQQGEVSEAVPLKRSDFRDWEPPPARLRGGADTLYQGDIRLVSNAAHSLSQNDALENGEDEPPRSAVNQPFHNPESASLTPSQISQQLRELGAVEVRLEPWGNSGQLYRFQAQMAMNASGDVEHHFQAIHADPKDAAQQVLQQVQAWINR